MINVFKQLAKSVLISLGLTAAASAANEGTHNKIKIEDNITATEY